MGFTIVGHLFFWRMKRAPVTDYLTGADQKFPDWLIEITFLGKVKTAVKSVIKASFGTKGFTTSDVLWGLRFSL